MKYGRTRVFAFAPIAAFAALALAAFPTGAEADDDSACARTIKATVDALDQPFFFNRLGAHQLGGMIYATETSSS